MDKITVSLSLWEASPFPINITKANKSKIEKELYLILRYQHGYSDKQIKLFLRGKGNQQEKENFWNIRNQEEEKLVIQNGGKYQN